MTLRYYLYFIMKSIAISYYTALKHIQVGDKLAACYTNKELEILSKVLSTNHFYNLPAIVQQSDQPQQSLVNIGVSLGLTSLAANF